jgi:tetratricopeptide (TPR) repeat protein
VTLASQLAQDWGHILVSAGRFDEASSRFEAALAGYIQTRRADLAVVALRDLAGSLIELGQLDRADEALRRAESIPVPGNLHPLMARLCTARGEQLQRSGQRAAAEAEYNRAEQLLSESIIEALPLSDSARLAGHFLELARVEARLARFDEAVLSVERSRQLSESAHRPATEGLVTLGQIRMAQGNSVAAQAALHEALDRAALLGDTASAEQAAGVLVHVHQIRANRARHGDRVFRQNTLSEANFTRAVLAGMGLNEHVAALDRVIETISYEDPQWL